MPMARSDKSKPQGSPPGKRRITVDPWEAVLLQELRRLRRHTVGGQRIADVASRSARHGDDPGAPESRPTNRAGGPAEARDAPRGDRGPFAP
jgi:hypothetical protein